MNEKLLNLIDNKEDPEKVNSEVIISNSSISENVIPSSFSKVVKKEKVSKSRREVVIAPHRYNRIKKEWKHIVEAIVDHLQLQIRMSSKQRKVELRSSRHTSDVKSLQKGHDFICALNCGFDMKDAISLVKLDDVFLESFSVEEVKFSLKGDHLSRAIGRLAGSDGTTKFTIENATKTRIIVDGSRVHILGSYDNIQFAKSSVCDLILGSPPGVVYNKLRSLSKRLKERF